MERCLCLAVFASLVVTACGGRGATAIDSPPNPGCTAVIITDPQAKLVTPADGATGVPVTLGTIVFSYSDPALTAGMVVAEPPAGLGGPEGPIQNANNGRAQATIPALQPGTKYTIRAISQATFGMCHSPVIGNLGSFTTQ